MGMVKMTLYIHPQHSIQLSNKKQTFDIANLDGSSENYGEWKDSSVKATYGTMPLI